MHVHHASVRHLCYLCKSFFCSFFSLDFLFSSVNFLKFYYPPLGVEVISEFQEFQESFKSLKLHKVFSKDEDASRKSKDGKCSIVVHLFCFELNLLMLNRFCSSNV